MSKLSLKLIFDLYLLRARIMLLKAFEYWVFDPTGWVEKTPTLDEQVKKNGATDEALETIYHCEHCGIDIK